MEGEGMFLREAKKDGFNKQDVLAYIETMNAEIDKLKKLNKELEEHSGDTAQVDTSAFDKLKDENAKIAEEKKAVIAEKDALQSQNAISAKQIKALALEVDKLRKQITEAENVGGSSKEPYLAEIAKLKMELSDKGDEILEEVEKRSVIEKKLSELKNLANADSEKITELLNAVSKAEAKAAEFEKATGLSTKRVNELEKQVDSLIADNEELKKKSSEGAFAPQFDISSIFADAQKTAASLTTAAKASADKIEKEAKERADNVIAQAQANAGATKADSDEYAEKTRTSADKYKANITEETDKKAAKTVADAEAKAAKTVAEAEILSAKVKDVAAGVKALLTQQLDTVSSSFNEIANGIGRSLNLILTSKISMDKGDEFEALFEKLPKFESRK